MSDFNINYEYLQNIVNTHLKTIFDRYDKYANLNESMLYSLLAGGKRIRPILVLAFYGACCNNNDISEKILNAACAVELLHTYSLIHDDLPCMDNDSLRRGLPTNHIKYGETTAVLAGDCLQAEAFQLLLSCGLPASRVQKMALELAKAAGLNGICGGQILDMQPSDDYESLIRIHNGKTASLLIACCCMGVEAAGGIPRQVEAAYNYASKIGLAFQIRDDMLDVISTEAELGKPIGSDVQNGKKTFVDLYGLEKCEQMINELTTEACQALQGSFQNVDFLTCLAEYLAGRNQ